MQPKNFYLTKRNKKWQVKFRDPDTGLLRAYVSTGETNKTRAERWA